MDVLSEAYLIGFPPRLVKEDIYNSLRGSYTLTFLPGVLPCLPLPATVTIKPW